MRRKKVKFGGIKKTKVTIPRKIDLPLKQISSRNSIKAKRGVVSSKGFIPKRDGFGTVKASNYLDWNKRNSSKNLLSWKETEEKMKTKRAVVLLHIFYNEHSINMQLVSLLKNIPLSFDLYVSLVKGREKNNSTKEFISTHFPTTKFIEVPNKGKDIGGKLTMFKYLLKKGYHYDYMLLLHDKMSPHSTVVSGESWRNNLLNGILSHNALKNGFRILEQDKEIVGFGSARWLRGGPTTLVSMVGPRAAVSYISKTLDRLGRKKPTHFGFIGGTMFWCRYSSMMTFWSIDTIDKVLSNLEKGDVREPSYTHAMERILGMILTSYNHKTLLGV